MTMNKQRGYTSAELLLVIVWIVGAIGWVLNIVHLVYMQLSPITLMLVLRVVGIFVPPLGAVLGYL